MAVLIKLTTLTVILLARAQAAPRDAVCERVGVLAFRDVELFMNLFYFDCLIFIKKPLVKSMGIGEGIFFVIAFS
jgi:hypothetical protein